MFFFLNDPPPPKFSPFPLPDPLPFGPHTRLQVDKLSYAGDRSSRDNRIGHEDWRGVSDFHHEPDPPLVALRRAAPAAYVLLAWLAVLTVALLLATQRLGRVAR